MSDDLLVQLLDVWISKDKVPDELSIERDLRDRDRPVIYFRWLDTNVEKVYGFNMDRYDEVWDRFNAYWDSRNDSRL